MKRQKHRLKNRLLRKISDFGMIGKYEENKKAKSLISKLLAIFSKSDCCGKI